MLILKIELNQMRDLFGLTTPPQIENKAPVKEKAEDENTGKKTEVKNSKSVHYERRVRSEIFLEDALPWHFKPGDCFHCFSFGDVDALAYLRAILKQQPLEYLLISTFYMSVVDVNSIAKWVEAGLIGRIDFYMGEIFGSKYPEVNLALKTLLFPMGGRAAVFRNHSKVMVGFGGKFDFVIEGSANINSNPRCEQTVITVDSGVARFYKEEIFDHIKSFNNDFPNWEAYKLMRDETF